MSAATMLESPCEAYLLWGIDPAYDLGNPAGGLKALDRATPVVACTTHRTPSLEQSADILLPIAAFAETSGTFVNAAVSWQSFRGTVAPPGEARPGWKLLRVLGNLVDLPDFEQVSCADVLAELKAICGGIEPDNRPKGDLQCSPEAETEGLTRVGNLPIYAVDLLVRSAPALRQTPSADAFGAYLSRAEAAAQDLAEGDAVQVHQGDSVVRAQVRLDDAVPAGCVRIPAGVVGSESLGNQIGPVSLTKAQHPEHPDSRIAVTADRKHALRENKCRHAAAKHV